MTAFKVILFKGKENEKIIVAPEPIGKLFRKALVLTKELNQEELTADTLDENIKFVVEVFGEQTTIDEIYEGYPSFKLSELANEAIYYVMTGMTIEEEVEDNKKK